MGEIYMQWPWHEIHGPVQKFVVWFSFYGWATSCPIEMHCQLIEIYAKMGKTHHYAWRLCWKIVILRWNKWVTYHAVVATCLIFMACGTLLMDCTLYIITDTYAVGIFGYLSAWLWTNFKWSFKLPSLCWSEDCSGPFWSSSSIPWSAVFIY